jgi:hypothetical protein
MVEEKKKRGRPKKIKEVVTEKRTDPVVGKMPLWEAPSGNERRDDLCIQMIMGIINKQGTIKYDFARDIFDTATKLAYDFGWMVEPKAKKLVFASETPLNEFADMIVGAVNENKQQEALANTPAAIFRALREVT